MSGGFTIHFPAKVGDVVYAVTGKGFVRKERITGYMVRGGDGGQIDVCVAYNDLSGNIYTSRLPMDSFGSLLFLTERQAELWLREKYENEGTLDGEEVH